MPGYSYPITFNVVPEDGPARVYNLALLTPTQGPVSTRVLYEPEKTSRLTPNRKIIEHLFGFRFVLRLRFEISVLAEEAWIADVFSSCGAAHTVVYVSVPGVPDRVVVCDSDFPRAPLGGKTLNGIETELEFRSVELLEAVPPILTPQGASQW